MVYATIYMNITDPQALAAYREKAGAALARHDGALVAAGPAPVRLEGSLDVPSMAGVLSFPDRDKALGWINDPALAEVHALRRSAGDSTILLIG